MNVIDGLPAHILLVHAIVVLVPLAALVLVLSVFRPTLRRRFAGANALLSVAVLALTPITTSAGQWLQERVGSTAVVREHTQLGDTAVYVTAPLALMALVVWWRGRESDAVEAAETERLSTSGPAVGAGGTATLARPVAARRTFLAPTLRAVGILVTVLAVLASAAAVYDVYLIGASGAKASWQDSFSSTPLPGAGGGRVGG